LLWDHLMPLTGCNTHREAKLHSTMAPTCPHLETWVKKDGLRVASLYIVLPTLGRQKRQAEIDSLFSNGGCLDGTMASLISTNHIQSSQALTRSGRRPLIGPTPAAVSTCCSSMPVCLALPACLRKRALPCLAR
jgi:hypothetical protein